MFNNIVWVIWFPLARTFKDLVETSVFWTRSSVTLYLLISLSTNPLCSLLTLWIRRSWRRLKTDKSFKMNTEIATDTVLLIKWVDLEATLNKPSPKKIWRKVPSRWNIMNCVLNWCDAYKYLIQIFCGFNFFLPWTYKLMAFFVGMQSLRLGSCDRFKQLLVQSIMNVTYFS